MQTSLASWSQFLPAVRERTSSRSDGSPRIRVLLVADARSIHAARFNSFLQEIGYEARLFHVDREGFFEDQNLAHATIYMPFFENFYYSGRNRLLITHPIPFQMDPTKGRQPFRRILARWGNAGRRRVQDLMSVVRGFAPDLIISARMQPEGYLVGEAKFLMGEAFMPPWIHFLWGTDIEFFGKADGYREDHLFLIRRTLSACDYLMSDTHRDADQAGNFGFKGEHLAVFPAHGGFDPEWLKSLRASVSEPRNLIFIKGREGSYVGRAMNIIAALDRIGRSLAGYRIVVLLATPNVQAILPALSDKCGVPVEIAQHVPYDDLMRLYAQSRIAISATTVDGIPSFMEEAMAMGALPLHSDMSSIREWINDGDNGLLFPVDDIAAIERAIIRGLSDDALIKEAAARNRALVEQRLNRDVLRTKFAEIVDRVLHRKQMVAGSLG